MGHNVTSQAQCFTQFELQSSLFDFFSKQIHSERGCGENTHFDP